MGSTKPPTSSTSPGEEAEPTYNPADPQSAPKLVNFHLRQLGLGEQSVDTGKGYVQRVLPDGLGWCRALALTEAAWPEGTELCVLVHWYPDAALRRNTNTGRVPPSAEEHWRDRLTATADALESLGYVVERNGPPRSPHTHWSAEFLVYRMAPGVAPLRLSPEAWAGAEPNPPHYQRSGWYPDPDPVREIEDVLGEASVLGRCRYSFDPVQPATSGVCHVGSITQTVWPPDAELCAWLRWWPADEFERAADTGVVPPGAHEHWMKQTKRVQDALEQAGYTVRWRARPWDLATENYADALVHRPKQQGASRSE
ncbi:hypothetical protein ABZ851_30275 [Streptomyces sp. NPDC047049]|uniref:hypothetical protein n=1 Tax=Streptomyces sp. NPDC047049 TaxID=3156688 RepID=UPI0033CDAFF2